MISKGVPTQTGPFSAQRGQAGASQAAPLELRIGVWVLNPTDTAAAADPVVDGKREFTVEVSGTLAPAVPLWRDRVLPRSAQPGYDRPACRSPSTADPLQSLTPGFPTGYAANLMSLLGKTSGRLLGVVAHHEVIMPRRVEGCQEHACSMRGGQKWGVCGLAPSQGE